MIFAGNKIYEICAACGKLVQLNKFIYGALHVCVDQTKPPTQNKPAEPPQVPPDT